MNIRSSDAQLAVWPALLGGPWLALVLQSAAYSSVGPACLAHGSGRLHLLAGTALVIVVAFTLLAWLEWRRCSLDANHEGRNYRVTESDTGQARQRKPFLAMTATAVGAISALVVAAIWLPIWFLSPCAA